MSLCSVEENSFKSSLDALQEFGKVCMDDSVLVVVFISHDGRGGLVGIEES